MITGYCLLVALAIIGIVTIYLEVVKSHRQSKDNLFLKKELIDLSNTLTTMYQAEGTASLLAFAENEKLKLEYDSLTYRVFEQIDSLRQVSTDLNINKGLDSLYMLLQVKRDNASKMFRLIKETNKNLIQEITKKTIVSRNDVDKLNALLANVTQTKDDTVKVVAEKKGLFQRIRDVVKPSTQDTLTQISKSSVSEKKDFEVPLLSDTIIDFIRKIDRQTQKKNAKLIQLLIARQQELYVIKELTGMQINKIMDAIKEREYQTNMSILKEKNESLRRSSSLVAIVGLSALVVAIFFMSWTLRSLNKAQQLQKNIQESKKHSEELLISREQLIYTITHDIKAPLSSITGFLDLLMSEDAFSRKQQYYLDNMYSSASHILDLVHNLLDFQSIEKEQLQLNLSAFSPSSLIRNIYESFLPLAQKKKLIFDLKSSFPEVKDFMSDPFYIRQIVSNLLSNAIKYTPKNGRVFLISSPEEGNQWKISVQDTGLGIDTEDQVKIFEEYVRLAEQNSEGEEGTGLGLTISKKLAALLGGTIEIKSQKGWGSIFTLLIPLTPVPEVAIPQQDETLDHSQGRILCVDDDQIQLNLFSELMKKGGWPCVCCANANEALSYLQTSLFDIIFVDIRIPGMDGYEFLKRIRESNFPQAETIPVIAFSADYRKSEIELKSLGFTGFLHKPFKAQQLLDIIEEYTSFRRNPNEIYPENDDGFGWQVVMDFLADDQDAATRIIDSFIEETNKNKELLEIAIQKKDKEAIKQISHRMLSLMRMISVQKVVSILNDFDEGVVSKGKKDVLFRLIDETIEKVKAMRPVSS